MQNTHIRKSVVCETSPMEGELGQKCNWIEFNAIGPLTTCHWIILHSIVLYTSCHWIGRHFIGSHIILSDHIFHVSGSDFMPLDQSASLDSRAIHVQGRHRTAQEQLTWSNKKKTVLFWCYESTGFHCRSWLWLVRLVHRSDEKFSIVGVFSLKIAI